VVIVSCLGSGGLYFRVGKWRGRWLSVAFYLLLVSFHELPGSIFQWARPFHELGTPLFLLSVAFYLLLVSFYEPSESFQRILLKVVIACAWSRGYLTGFLRCLSILLAACQRARQGCGALSEVSIGYSMARLMPSMLN